MSKYKVITLAMAVKSNRIAKFGEIVDDSELTLNPSALIAEGFIEEVEDEATDAEVEETEVEEVEVETEVETNVDAEVEEKSLSKKDEVKAKLAAKK